jgi:type IV pilus assembly protein PilM
VGKKQMLSTKLPVLYREKPLFGFDIGHGSIKIAQLSPFGKDTVLDGYGTILFDASAIRDGEIVDYEVVAAATQKLFTDNITGSISTSTAAVSLPVSHSFNRVIRLPAMNEKDIRDAVRLEAEQYIPIAIDDLYIDYQLINVDGENRDYLVSAAPKRVIDSYMNLFAILGIEAIVMEPSLLSVTRVVRNSELSNLPTLVIDCGSTTTDLIIYNNMAVQVTGTVKFGGNTITKSLMDSMSLTELQANTIKSKYGLDSSKKQTEISSALEVPLRSFSTEIRKIIRYFEDRGGDANNKVEQIIILGGGANLPGFSAYLTNSLRIPTRLCSIWQHISFDGLQPPNLLDTSMYATAAGLALIKPHEVVS